MTIAAGFICTDGIVLGADTKESYESDHTYVRKLEIIQEGDCRAAIVGSGESYPVDYIVPKIKEAIKANLKTTGNVQESLSGLMAEIYSSDAMTAYPKSYPTSHQTQFLVAVRSLDSVNALFLVNSSLVSRVEDGARVIGYGLMQNMADELSSLNLTVKQASTAAMFLIYETKRRHSFVGGVTHFYTLTSTGLTDVPTTWDQPSREALLNDLRILYYRLVLIVATPDVAKNQYAFVISNLVRRARKIRNEFKKIEKQCFEWMMRMVGGKKLKLKDLPENVREFIEKQKQDRRKSSSDA